LSRGDRI